MRVGRRPCGGPSGRVLSEVGKVRRQGLVGAAVNRDVGLGCVHVFILEEKLEIWVFVAYTHWRLISLKKKNRHVSQTKHTHRRYLSCRLPFLRTSGFPVPVTFTSYLFLVRPRDASSQSADEEQNLSQEPSAGLALKGFWESGSQVAVLGKA